ncbi:MAG: glycosyltransferase [Sphingobacteriales bacterium]|nr:MAG: glycosyltransferase [Sphingobacteriales bacterium]
MLFLLPYPVQVAPSQRFRVEAYFPVLEAAGLHWKCAPFFDAAGWQVLYRKGAMVQKGWAVIKGFLKRLYTTLLVAPRYRVIFVHREAAPLGPPVFEWLLSKVFRKKLIYDFDDAIWIPNVSANNQLARRLKAFWKIGRICSYAHTVVGGNDFLCAYARQHNMSGSVVKIPTVVDTTHRYNRLQNTTSGTVTVGWTGSHSTLPYLDAIMPVLQELQAEIPFTFVVIADKKPSLPLQDWVFIPWSPQTEIDDLLAIHIGVMPLASDSWSEGKCGFKLIQYLALGIPAVASPVGVNTVIIEEGINGFLAATPQSWKNALRTLLEEVYLRQRMGQAGRLKVEEAYSLAAYAPVFLSLFR